jgi:serine/threonine protein kinase/tetratricopeptide (TPR) repeat protein
MSGPSAVEEIFLAALERGAPEERAAFLDAACRGDPELRGRVERLLRAHPKAGGFLERPAVGQAVTVDSGGGAAPDAGEGAGAPAVGEEAGTWVGPYRLVQQLGEGGMGAVWVAEQEEPVRRRVALKLIKPGMDSGQVIRRFEAERQALALMDHTNIARVLDAGTTATGRPYFVMELVKGVPITTYCDELHLPVRERLALFVPVCQAIQHAHQKGVIHRDVKPSNVLVSVQDGVPVPKVIDFGIAKALHARLADRTMDTEVGAVVGTLEYMSPEQAELSALDIDTRADVYALGVLLYELLTGTTPLDRARLKAGAFTEILRLIKEEDPPKPSTRLTDSKGTLAGLARQRRTEPARLAREVRGELDCIVMKCLEKDRTRRYESAGGLARDVERYLADEPVEAQPPSMRYRVGKFVRRNRGPVAAAFLVLLALLAGVAAATWGLIRAERARASEAERAEGERQAKDQEARERDRAVGAEKQSRESEADTQAFSRFLVEDVLAAARPQGEQGGLGVDVTVRRALAEAAGKIPERFRGRPRAEALARHDLGVTFRLAGDPERAVEQLQRALDLRRQSLRPDHRDTLETMNSLAVAYRAAGKFDAAIALGEGQLALVKGQKGPEHPETLSVQNNLAVAYHDAGMQDKALALMEETFKLRKAVLGPENAETLDSMSNLAAAYQMAGKLDLARPLTEEALKLRRAALGPEHPATLATLGNLAAMYWSMNRLDRSVPLFEEALRLRQRKQGADHPDTMFVAFNLGVNYADAGRPGEAVAVFDEWLPRALAARKPGQPPRDFGVLAGADAYTRAGRPEKAEPLLRERAALQKQATGAGSPEYAVVLAQLGGNLLRQRKWAEAEPVLRDGLAIRERVESGAWTTSYAKSQLGWALLGLGRYADAEPPLLQGYEGLKRRAAQIPAGSKPVLNEALERLVRLYDAWGRPDDAARRRKELEAVQPRPRRSTPGRELPGPTQNSCDTGATVIDNGELREPAVRA